MMISGTPSHGLILHKTDSQTGVKPWLRKRVLKEQSDLERVRRTCRRICAWVSKGRGKASWDIKQGRLAQNCFCSECVLSYRHQKSNAIVDVVLISKIVINIDFCTESHYVATTCMNVNWAPGIYGIQKVKDGHGSH